MNYKDLSSEQKDKLIESLSLFYGRTGRDSSALVYATNEEVIDRITDLFKDRIHKDINMKGYN